jgi:hypothetical protein
VASMTFRGFMVLVDLAFPFASPVDRPKIFLRILAVCTRRTHALRNIFLQNGRHYKLPRKSPQPHASTVSFDIAGG